MVLQIQNLQFDYAYYNTVILPHFINRNPHVTLDTCINMVYNPFMDKRVLDKVMILRIDQETNSMLRDLSVKNDRSMSAQVRYLIRKEYDRRATTDKPPITYTAE